MRAAEREALAKRLLIHARIVAAVIKGRKHPTPILTAVGAARTMVQLADDVLRALIEDARRDGHSWSEIGEVLGTTRQAAFQRFS